MGMMPTQVCLELLRLALIDVVEHKVMTGEQLRGVSTYLRIILMSGDIEQKKSACCYVFTARTNLQFGSPPREALTILELNFRTLCAPLLNEPSAFMPAEYVGSQELTAPEGSVDDEESSESNDSLMSDDEPSSPVMRMG